MSYAKIELKLFKDGMLFSCNEADIEEIVPVGDSRRLIKLVNDVEELCNPCTTYVLTEFGEKIRKEINDDYE